MKRAVVLGVTGQDGSYLSELLLREGFFVVGVRRRCACPSYENLQEVLGNKNFVLVEGDVCDPKSLGRVFREYEPDHVYNLAAQSHVGTSFHQPRLTWEVNAVGAMNVIDELFTALPDARLYQASTSEMFGDNYSSMRSEFTNNEYRVTKFQDENTPFRPRSPYAIAKLAAHNTIVMHREAYDRFACAGILFNHECCRRGINFVSRKVTSYVAGISTHPDLSPLVLGKSARLKLGNLDANRDWGYAPDYVEAMYSMMNQDSPQDFVIATGQTRSVRELVDCAFAKVGIYDWSQYVEIDPSCMRPAEVPHLLGVATKAKNILGWVPKTSFDQMIETMIIHDQENLRRKVSTVS